MTDEVILHYAAKKHRRYNMASVSNYINMKILILTTTIIPFSINHKNFLFRYFPCMDHLRLDCFPADFDGGFCADGFGDLWLRTASASAPDFSSSLAGSGAGFGGGMRHTSF